MNSVRLYSSGVALVSREYALDGKNPTKVSIPVKKADLDEVVASITVFGDVQLPEPPSYTPVNADSTKLFISPTSALKDTVTKLAGSNITVTKPSGAVSGKLVGAHTYEETNANGMTTERMKIAVMSEHGLVLIPEAELVSLQFTDEAIQAEYGKALSRSYQSIKPDSSFVDLTVVGQKGAKNAVVSYVTPVAAWKTCYQLRSVKGTWELVRQGVVDNDTEDDWTNTIVSVINGEPISFETELAEISRPVRQKVRIVPLNAQGAVNAQEVVRKQEMGMAPSSTISPSVRLSLMSRQNSLKTCTDFDDEAVGGDGNSMMQMASGTANLFYGSAASQVQADASESGDFSIFTTASPVSIGSKKSALIPMSRCFLGSGTKTLLVYKEKDDPRRPFRAIKLTNETTLPFGKGYIEVYLDGDFQGKCILEATRPGEDALLLHAKETGVKVFKRQGAVESRRTSIRIKDGVAQCETASSVETTYIVSNSKAEEFDLEIEHPRIMQHSTVSFWDKTLSSAETTDGWRISLKLAPNAQEVEVTVVEDRLLTQGISIATPGGVGWINGNVIAVKNPLARNKAIQKVVELQGKVDEIAHAINVATLQVQTCQHDQEELLKVIPSGHTEQANAWKTELAANRKEMKSLQKEEIPALNVKLREGHKEVQAALAALTASWSERKDEDSAEPSR